MAEALFYSITPMNDLLTIKELFEEAKIPFLLTGSTLLGIYRDKNPLGLIEIAVLRKDLTKKKLNALKKLYPFEMRGSGTMVDISIMDFDFVRRIEVQPIYFLGAWAYKNLRDSECLIWPKHMYEKWDMLEWEGQTWNIPSDVEKWLTFYYGDWKSPNGSWNWAKASNYRRLVEKDGIREFRS